MKKITVLLTMATLAVAVGVQAQGTLYMNNYDSDGSTGSAGGTSGIFDFTTTGLNDTTNNPSLSTMVEILAGASAGSLAPLASATEGGNPTSYTIDGYGGDVSTGGGFFDAGYGVVTGVGADALAYIEVEAWSGAATFALAQTTVGAWWGVSSEWSQDIGSTVPAVGAPSPATLNMTSAVIMQQVAAVPEPTTLALAGLGGAALLAFRRRKV